MDSCNTSSSLQSSSGGGGGGGDDEFDSQAFFSSSSITTATNNNNSIGVRIENSNQQNPNLSVFDTLSFLNPSSSSFSLLSPPSTFPNPNPNPKVPNNSRLYINPPATSTKAPPTPSPRNPKKRSRASRRAPTTVLTTDTSNFRAMVQEFTGIPAPPFSSSSASLSTYPRSRFDFSTPPFLLKPYPQIKHHHIPTLNASSATDSIINAAGGYNNNYQLPPSSSLNFQSLLQSQHSNNMAMAMAMAAGGADSYGASDVGLSGLIGSGWSPDVAGEPTRYGMSNSKDQGNGEKRTREARGEGNMVESWICSSD